MLRWISIPRPATHDGKPRPFGVTVRDGMQQLGQNFENIPRGIERYEEIPRTRPLSPRYGPFSNEQRRDLKAVRSLRVGEAVSFYHPFGNDRITGRQVLAAAYS
jgi:hypothetical protein